MQEKGASLDSFWQFRRQGDRYRVDRKIFAQYRGKSIFSTKKLKRKRMAIVSGLSVGNRWKRGMV